MSIYVKQILTCKKIEHHDNDEMTLIHTFDVCKVTDIPAKLEEFYLVFCLIPVSDENKECSLVIVGPSKAEIQTTEFSLDDREIGSVNYYAFDLRNFPIEEEGVYFFNFRNKNKDVVGFHRIKIVKEADV